MYKRLEIIAHMATPVVVNDELYLDGILYGVQRRRELGDSYYNLPRFGLKPYGVKTRLPLKRLRGSYLCSMARFRDVTTYTNRYRKRTNELSATKWVEPKRIYTDQKVYKNYDIPLSVVTCSRIHWIVVGNEQAIRELLKSVTYIGKKQSQGYGKVTKWEIRPTNKKGLRHFRVYNPDGDLGSYAVDMKTVSPPYCNRKYNTCVLQKF